MDNYQTFIHRRTYSRYVDDVKRRETWPETVNRYVEYFKAKTDNSPEIPWDELQDAILNLEVMPSMRAMQTAGKALDRDNVAGYNCAYIAIDHPRAFDEALYILMCGTGVGFSVERANIDKLPEVPDDITESDTCIQVRDSKKGWQEAYRELLALLYSGKRPKWDMAKVRAAGSRLRTFGGRASGPEPLEDLFRFTCELFDRARGRRLSSIECHDMMCKIAEIVVCGGVRRSALISLSNLTDTRMRNAKAGDWYNTDRHRALANNSAAYTENPDFGAFTEEWLALYRSKSGERGIFSRKAAEKTVLRNGRREGGWAWGTNPCSEIILRPMEFCNLTEVVIRPGDKMKDLERKVRLATILGTLQSTLTDFRGLRKQWKQNCEEERLLGVSLTGIYDNSLTGNPDAAGLAGMLQSLRNISVDTNKKYADILGINPSAAITCVKPSGTVSQLVNSASGIHPRHAEYYIRRVRADKKDPLADFLREAGVPCEEDFYNPNACVFSFPIKAPGSVTRDKVSALEHLRLWLVYARHWCEHKPSVTVTVRENEWADVGAFVYNNFDEMSGVSFLPYDDHTYRQAPYETIDEETYNRLYNAMPTDIDWDSFVEEDDVTTSSQEMACTGGQCDVI